MKSNSKVRQLPQNLKQPLLVSKFVQLYLTKRHNSFKFQFYDMLNNQFLIQIGQKINCSCIPGYFDHCIHSFWVMQKIFKLKDNDPFIWKDKYTQTDLKYLVKSQLEQYKKINLNQNHQKQIIKIQHKQMPQSIVVRNQQCKIKKNQLIKNQSNALIQSQMKNQIKRQIPIISGQQQQVPIVLGQQVRIVLGEQPKQQKKYVQLLNTIKEQLYSQQKQLFGSCSLKFCPICHQDITYETSVYECKQVCHNYFHIKCLKFWIKHQRKTLAQTQQFNDIMYQSRYEIRVTCPMCRTKFPQNIDQLLIQSHQIYKKYYQSHNLNCAECKVDICLKIYHCLLCKDINLCETCYKGWKHQQHDRFLMKNHKRSLWTVPSGRNAFNMSKLDSSLQYIKKMQSNLGSNNNQSKNSLGSKNTKNSSDTNKNSLDSNKNSLDSNKNISNGNKSNPSQIKVLFGENYQKFLQSKMPKISLTQYIKQSLIDIQKQIHKTYKQIDYNQNTLKCIVCKKTIIIGMKRLYCKAKCFMDEKCLNFFIKNHMFQCPFDKNFILPGLQGLTITLNQPNITKKKLK